MEEKIFAKGFKGFDPDMKCRGKQYAENTVFEEKGGNICDSGVMHFCEYPLSVFEYYSPADGSGKINIFAPVEALAEPQKREDKSATTKIRIGARIDFAGLAKAAVDFVLERVKKEKTTSNTGNRSAATNTGDYSVASVSGDYSVASNTGFQSAATNTGDYSAATNTGDYSVATNTGFQSAATNTGDYSVASNTGFQSAATNTGDYSVASVSGDYSAATNTGNRSAATNTGNRSAATNTGDYSVASVSGDYSAATNTGNRSAATNTGNRSAATNTGNRSAATNTGDYSAASVGGKESFAIATGIEGKVKGALGCYIACAEWTQDENFDWHIKNFKTAKVDGKKIKPDTFYMLKNGKFVEACKDEE